MMKPVDCRHEAQPAIGAESGTKAVDGEEKGTNPMEKTLFALVALLFVAAWVVGVLWMIKRFRKTWEMLKSGQLKVEQGKFKVELGPIKVAPQDQASSPPSLRLTPEAPRTNSLGIVTETLEESLAKHRKKVEQELAQLMKQQSRSK